MEDEKIKHLEYLYTKYGDFEVAIGYPIHKPNKTEISVTKEGWMTYSDIIHNQELIKKINLRSIFPQEIVFDLESIERFDNTLSQFDSLEIGYYAYLTYSRGGHIHTFWEGLQHYPIEQRTKVKEYLIKKFNSDSNKKSHRTMIALEYSIHPKSNKIKSLYKIKEGVNDIEQYSGEALSEDDLNVPKHYEAVTPKGYMIAKVYNPYKPVYRFKPIHYSGKKNEKYKSTKAHWFKVEAIYDDLKFFIPSFLQLTLDRMFPYYLIELKRANVSKDADYCWLLIHGNKPNKYSFKVIDDNQVDLQVKAFVDRKFSELEKVINQ